MKPETTYLIICSMDVPVQHACPTKSQPSYGKFGRNKNEEVIELLVIDADDSAVNSYKGCIRLRNLGTSSPS